MPDDVTYFNLIVGLLASNQCAEAESTLKVLLSLNFGAAFYGAAFSKIVTYYVQRNRLHDVIRILQNLEEIQKDYIILNYNVYFVELYRIFSDKIDEH